MRGTALVGLAIALAACGGKTGLDEPLDLPVTMPPDVAAPMVPPSGTRGIAAGLFHSCAVRDDGSVWCWGFNTQGQLGDGTAEIRTTPVRVRDIDDAIFVRAGREHTCALRVGGRVSCWGSNLAEQLGGATFDFRSTTPVDLRDLGDPVDLALGGQHGCVLGADGAVICWGDDSAGQTGAAMDPTHHERFSRVELPPASHVAAGWQHTCAVLAGDGAVSCWGANAHGQLGAPTDVSSSRRPIAVPAVLDAVQISLGDYHSCATTADGRVLCWGDNTYGQLGDGTREPRGGPVRAAGIDDAVQVSAGHEHTCALRRTGAVVCWGRADLGELGRVPDAEFVPVRVLDGLAGVTELALGWRHGCALDATLEVSCWGRNVEGQLGRGDDAALAGAAPVSWMW